MSRIELTKKWWNANRPKDLKSPELEKALGAVEQAEEPETLLSALAAVPAAIAKVSRGLDKKTQKDVLKDLDALTELANEDIKKVTAKAKVDAKAKLRTEDDTGDEAGEETPDDKLFDHKLLGSNLKLALRRPLMFGFALGAKSEDSALAIVPRGSSRKLATQAKAKSGAVKACWGTVRADENDPKTLVISLESPLISGVARAFRKYFQGAKLVQFRKFRVLVDGQEVEIDGSDDEPAEGVPLPASAPESSEGPAVAPTPKELEVLEDKRRLFKLARAKWVAAKNKAEQDLEVVKDAAHEAYLADAAQFPKIVKGCKEIDTILDLLDDQLRDTLDQYASTPLRNQAKLKSLSSKASEILNGYYSSVANNPLMKAIDKKEFADVTIHAPIMKALEDLKRSLQ